MAVKNILTSDLNNLLNVPKITQVKRDLITTPQKGTLIYLTDTDDLQFYDGSQWFTLSNVIPPTNDFYLNSFYLSNTETYGVGISTIGSTNPWVNLISHGPSAGWSALGGGFFQNVVPGLWSISIKSNVSHPGVANNGSIAITIFNIVTSLPLTSSIFSVTPTGEIPHQYTFYDEIVENINLGDQISFIFENNATLNFDILGGTSLPIGTNTIITFKKLD